MIEIHHTDECRSENQNIPSERQRRLQVYVYILVIRYAN